MHFVLDRNQKLQADLIDQLFNSSEKRLARILLTLANTGLGTQSNTITMAINQEMLATMVGTTRSRINQFMNKFRKLGYIDYNGHIEVNNSLLNLILHDQSNERYGASINAHAGKLFPPNGAVIHARRICRQNVTDIYFSQCATLYSGTRADGTYARMRMRHCVKRS